MKIHSEVLGMVEVDDTAVINFPAGIPAFEEAREFVILPLEEKGPFFYLQAVKQSNLCLVIADPFVFFPDYRVDLPDEELKKIDADAEGKSLSVLCVLTIPEEYRKTTANLFAPLIIDTKSKKGMQFIPQKSEYNTRHLIFSPQAENVQAAAGQGE